MKFKIFVIFLLIFFILIHFSFCFATEETEIENTNEIENTTEEIQDINILHQDLSAIFSILVFFVLVILLYFVYKFFNMFFTF